ncbi:EutN/CcmL family microcompartment protein, partial [candidate division CSSED10-310 bacterium]
WLKHKSAALQDAKLVQTLDYRFMPDGSLSPGKTTAVSVDPLISNIGEKVLVCTGSRVRDVVLGSEVATKKVVISIIDDFYMEADFFPAPILGGKD